MAPSPDVAPRRSHSAAARLLEPRSLGAITSFPPATANHRPPKGVRRYEKSPLGAMAKPLAGFAPRAGMRPDETAYFLRPS